MLRLRRAKKSHWNVLSKGMTYWHRQNEVGSGSFMDIRFQSRKVMRDSGGTLHSSVCAVGNMVLKTWRLLGGDFFLFFFF